MGATAEDLIELSIPFVDTIKNRTAGAELEDWLNTEYAPGSDLYDALSRTIIDGVDDGWAANIEVDGPNYRRSRIAEPSERLSWFSVTAVYMNSVSVYRGQYHQHPYGELNMVVPLNEGAVLGGPRGWQGAGWTAPDPASHHYPKSRAGLSSPCSTSPPAASRTTSARPPSSDHPGPIHEPQVRSGAPDRNRASTRDHRRGCNAQPP